ncbi:fibronectin type III domain-containing protein [Kibdelosporangium philippinense]|uniref:Fibronectin type III domain-containing protein n=1 Tax=Kibdelosporangium philippinense TaxID=211113 RepID=A0ABS8Z3V8_9PSEU|nr:fibronectin type III domain-containing protein [Kibdelosporangium philippinense]MCE7002525.1 fibronectin type III domain-containing protein [Kibdelosporangium philippinense]
MHGEAKWVAHLGPGPCGWCGGHRDHRRGQACARGPVRVDRPLGLQFASADGVPTPITSYQISWRASTGQTASTTAASGQRSVTISSLTNGSSYVFTVAAVNRVGTGAGASAQATPTSPTSPPGVPANLYARIKTGDTDARVTCPPPPRMARLSRLTL